MQSLQSFGQVLTGAGSLGSSSASTKNVPSTTNDPEPVCRSAAVLAEAADARAHPRPASRQPEALFGLQAEAAQELQHQGVASAVDVRRRREVAARLVHAAEHGAELGRKGNASIIVCYDNNRFGKRSHPCRRGPSQRLKRAVAPPSVGVASAFQLVDVLAERLRRAKAHPAEADVVSIAAYTLAKLSRNLARC
jgi:hypothetical protein